MKSLPYDSRQIANHFIRFYRSRGRPISIMRVLKLVYFSHGWCLAMNNGKPLINDYVEAWKFGPVVSTVYFAFRPHGVFDLAPLDLVEEKEIAPDIEVLLNWVDKTYGKLSGKQLSLLTHIKGGPWHRVYRPGVSNLAIPNPMIRQHFEERLNKDGD